MGQPDDTDPKILRQMRGLNVDPDAPAQGWVPRSAWELIDQAADAVRHQSDIARLNKSSELVAEVAAKDWVKRTYGAQAELVPVPRRANGVPILDLVFKTGPKQFLVIEAKSFFSEL